MALSFEEGLAGNLTGATGLVLGAFLLRRLAPGIAPNLRGLAVSGLKLFAEAEFERDDGIIGKLARNTVQSLLRAIDSGESPDAAEQAGRQIIIRFEQQARARSERHGWHRRDKTARYRHHMRKLKSAVEDASGRLTAKDQAILQRVCDGISEDW